MKKNIVIIFTSAVLLVLPFIVLAYPGAVDSQGLIQVAINILNVLGSLFGVFAVIMFLVAGFLFLSANGESSKVSQAKQAILWGFVGVIVGVLSFGIVEAISSALGF